MHGADFSAMAHVQIWREVMASLIKPRNYGGYDMLGAPCIGRSPLVCHVRSVQGAATYGDCQECEAEWLQTEH